MHKNLIISSSYLNRAEKLEPDGGGAVLKFTKPGDTIVARFIGRDTVKTKMGDGKRLIVDIVESNIEGVEPGPAVIFESSHVTQIFDRENLMPGQGFMLKLCEVDKKTRFKRFGFDRLPEIDNSSDDGNIPPRDTNSAGKSRVGEHGAQPAAKSRW